MTAEGLIARRKRAYRDFMLPQDQQPSMPAGQ